MREKRWKETKGKERSGKIRRRLDGEEMTGNKERAALCFCLLVTGVICCARLILSDILRRRLLKEIDIVFSNSITEIIIYFGSLFCLLGMTGFYLVLCPLFVLAS